MCGGIGITMANRGEKDSDLYAVLGLKKDCTESDLRNAYKKLAMKWHPDRCSASGNSKLVDEAKKKFQAIQQAYSVLSDANKRFLYDVGIYESDDDENGMSDFLNEMATMMSQTKPNGNAEESFEELQQLFEEMFQADTASSGNTSHAAAACSASSTYVTYSESSSSNKRNSTEMNFGKAEDTCDFDSGYHNFCLGVDHVNYYLLAMRIQNESMCPSLRYVEVTGGGSPRHQEANGSRRRNSRRRR